MKLQLCFAGFLAGLLVPLFKRAAQALVSDSYTHRAPYLILGNLL